MGFDKEELQPCLPLVALAGVLCVSEEEVGSEQPVKQHHVHNGEEAQARRPRHQDVERYLPAVTGQPAAHPAQSTHTKHQKPAAQQQ